jgi:hypothetical protein
MSPANTSEKYLLPVILLSLLVGLSPQTPILHPHIPALQHKTDVEPPNYKWKALHGRSIPSTYSVLCNQERKGPENM